MKKARQPRRNPRPLAEYIDRYKGHSAIVIGGGPSAPEDLRKALELLEQPSGLTFQGVELIWDANPIYFSANHHGYVLGLPVAFAVHVDRRWNAMGFTAFLRQFGAAPTIGQLPDDDIDPPRTLPNMDSGLMACWVAQQMGCFPVVPCGFDRFTGVGDQYFHTDHTSGRRDPIAKGREEYRIEKAGITAIRPVSGPLLDYFPHLTTVSASHNIRPT